jgi:predicted RNA methylase
LKKGNTRKTGKEQYYTLQEIAHHCTSRLFSILKKKEHLDDILFIEPAGGTGEIIDALETVSGKNCLAVLSMDIEPKHRLVQKDDFLISSTIDTLIDQRQKELIPNKKIVVFTNPPFGRMNSLSVKFFNRSALFADYIAFIIPKAWRKWSVQNRLDDSFHLIHDEDLSDVCFYVVTHVEG